MTKEHEERIVRNGKERRAAASGLTSSEAKRLKAKRYRCAPMPEWSADAGRCPHFSWKRRRCFSISNVAHQINEEIRDKEVRLIGATGEQLGIMTAEEALRIAEEQGIDLVKISPTAVPPVCKLLDYGKFRFEQAKKEKEARKNQHIVEIKEIRMSPSIDIGDFNVKLKNAQKFVLDGNRVKVTVRFRGREMAHTEIGETLLKRFAEECADIAAVDKQPKLEGRHMSMFIAPKPGQKK